MQDDDDLIDHDPPRLYRSALVFLAQDVPFDRSGKLFEENRTYRITTSTR